MEKNKKNSYKEQDVANASAESDNLKNSGEAQIEDVTPDKETMAQEEEVVEADTRCRSLKTNWLKRRRNIFS